MTRPWNPVLSWMEDEQKARIGDGISRPMPKARTREFKLLVRHGIERPMTFTMQAESTARAIKYAQARWPNAAVEAVK